MGINAVFEPASADVNKARELPGSFAQGHCCTYHLSTQARLCLMHPDHEKGIWFLFWFIYIKSILGLKENLLTSEAQNGFGIYAVPVNREVSGISNFLRCEIWKYSLHGGMKPGLLDLPLYFCPWWWMLLLCHLSFYLPNIKSEPRKPEEKCAVSEENVLKLIVQLWSPCWKELSQNISNPTEVIIEYESLSWKE